MGFGSIPRRLVVQFFTSLIFLSSSHALALDNVNCGGVFKSSEMTTTPGNPGAPHCNDSCVFPPQPWPGEEACGVTGIPNSLESSWMTGYESTTSETQCFCAYSVASCPGGLAAGSNGLCPGTTDPEENVNPERETGEPETCGTGQPSSDNPIYFGSGNKLFVETDFQAVGTLPLRWERTYNSIDGIWRFSYSRKLDFVGTNKTDVIRDDGRVYGFTLVNGTWTPWSDTVQTLTYDASADEWTFIDRDDSVEVYDSAGLLVSITNRAGQTKTFTYASGLLASVTDAQGRVLNITHTSGKVTSVNTPGGFVYTYAYDANGMLEYVSFPDDTPLDSSDDPTIQYHYENTTHTDLVTGITDEKGVRYSTYAYDVDRNATLSELAGSVEKTTVTYGTNTASVTNELGRVSDYTFVIKKGIRKVSQVDGQPTTLCGATVASQTYDYYGFVDKQTDENGNVTDYDFDERGLEISKTEAFGTADAVTTTKTWHTTLRLPTQIVKPGQTIDMTYDSEGRMLTRTVTDTQTQTVPYVTTGNSKTTTYTYNAAGLVAAIDGPRTDVTDVTTYTYDVDGNLTSISNPLGHTTQIVSRDARGLPLQIDDSNGTRTEMTYTPRGRLASRTVKSSQGDSATVYTYDEADLLVRIDLPSGGYLAYEYDDAHRVVAMSNELEERVSYTLDGAGNATQIVHSGPGGTVFQSMNQVFDELSRLRTLTDGVNNSTTFTYDDNDNLTQSDDALSRTTSQVFDGLDRVKSVTDAASGVVQQTYDDRGNLLSVTDPRGVLTSYVYDGLDRLIQEVSADAGTTTYTLDSAGNVTQVVDARGVVSNMTYDALNRLTSITYPADVSQNRTFGYDAGTNGVGRLSSITDNSGSTTYSYDDRGNITQDSRIVDGTTYVTGYGYDLANNVTQMTYPSGRVVNFGLDTQSRTRTVSHTLASVTEYLVDDVQYDGRGALKTIRYGNGVFQSYDYDAAGRLSQIDLNANFNGVPVAYSDQGATDLSTSLTLDVILNDYDINGTALIIHDVTQPASGSVTINGDQTINFTPAGPSAYTATFTYRVSDGAGISNWATVTVNVTDVSFVDTDGDGLSDQLETLMGLDPNDASDAVADVDGDGVSNYDEYLANTDPFVNDAGLSSAIASRNPFAHWKLDQTSGSFATDSSPNNWAPAFFGNRTYGATSVQETGNAMDFNDGGMRLSYTPPSFNIQGDYTIEGLVRWTSDNYSYLHTKFSYVSGQLTGTFISTHTGGGLRFYERNDAYLWAQTKNLNDGQWRHLAFVRRGNNMEIWINGELDAVTTAVQPNVSAVTGQLKIMADNSTNRDTIGSMDDWAIHTQALTPAEIKAHFLSLGDKDLDNIPTSYELAHWHDPLDANDATDDFDGDGATQYDEYVASTDPMVHPQGYNAAVLADTPSGFWTLDDVTTTASDLSGNNNDGVYTGSYTQSETAAITEGQSVSLASGSIDTAVASTDFEPQGDYSIEAYLKWSDTGYDAIIGTQNYPIGPYVYKNLSGCCTSNGKITFRDRNENGYRLGSNASGLNDGTWRHFAFVRRGSQLEIWINGLLDSTLSLSSVTAHDTHGIFKIMANDTGADQVAFYNHALSAGDIRQHIYQGKEPPPVVKSRGRDLPNNLDRWLKPGSLIAVWDKPSGKFEVYRLDASGKREQVNATESLVARATVRAVRTEDEVHVYFENTDNQTWIKRSHSIAPRLLAVSGGSVSETWTYSYDAVGNITQVNKPAGIEQFGYDVLDRLDTYTLPGDAPVTYSYDGVGNRLSETQAGVTQSHTYGTNDNRLTAKAGSTLTYDAAGNPISDQGGVRLFTYDQEKRISTVTDNSVQVASYTYNSLGQRVRKEAGSSDIDYVYDQNGMLIGEYNNGALLKEYVYLEGAPLAQIDNNSTTYLHVDHLGTPRMGTGLNQQVLWRWDSDPFGAAVPNEDPDGDLNNITVNLRFPGQYFDVETQQHYNYFRTYDPWLGRYAQSDPLRLAGGLNLYSYVSANPLKYSDRFGLHEVGYPHFDSDPTGKCLTADCAAFPDSHNEPKSSCERNCILKAVAYCSAAAAPAGKVLKFGTQRALGLSCSQPFGIACKRMCDEDEAEAEEQQSMEDCSE